VGRTVREFKVNKKVWPLAEAWAEENGYREVESEASHRLYRKGGGMTAAHRVWLESKGERVRLEAWVPAGFMQRLFTFFILPAEMEIDSDRSGQTLPRKQARTAVNKLLKQLGQAEIK
jgi:hypothetical protein